MSETVKSKKSDAKTVQEVADILDIPAGNIKSYNHCLSKEEVEMEIYGEYLASGHAEEVASEMAKQIAGDLWTAQA
ncbi:MAG: hypothetical protein ACLQF0_05555 [Dissulfurispiraceae bacterium]